MADVVNPDITFDNNEELVVHVTQSLMGVLVAVYESKLIAKVNMNDVLRLYGMEPEEEQWIVFKSKEFQKDYKHYKYNQQIIKQYQNHYDDVPNPVLH